MTLEKILTKKNEILMRRKNLQKKVKNYIHNHLNPVKKNTDSTKGNFVQPLSIPEILAELQIADDYYRALPISKG